MTSHRNIQTSDEKVLLTLNQNLLCSIKLTKASLNFFFKKMSLLSVPPTTPPQKKTKESKKGIILSWCRSVPLQGKKVFPAEIWSVREQHLVWTIIALTKVTKYLAIDFCTRSEYSLGFSFSWNHKFQRSVRNTLTSKLAWMKMVHYWTHTITSSVGFQTGKNC